MKENKRSIFTVSNLVVALICFVVFLVAGIGSYYMTVGEFVTAQLWVLYIALALVGAISMFLHWYWFAVLYYIGCALGWASGWFIGGLKGDFAPTAGLIVTFALIAIFAILGAILQFKSLKKRHDRRKEEKAQAKAQEKARAETDKLSAELAEARKEKEAAEAALAAAAETRPTPEEPTSGAFTAMKEEPTVLEFPTSGAGESVTGEEPPTEEGEPPKTGSFLGGLKDKFSRE